MTIILTLYYYRDPLVVIRVMLCFLGKVESVSRGIAVHVCDPPDAKPMEPYRSSKIKSNFKKVLFPNRGTLHKKNKLFCAEMHCLSKNQITN